MIKNIIIDLGHGGMTEQGEYTTAPAKMFDFGNGMVAYEGVLNREIGSRLIDIFKSFSPELNIITTVDPEDPTDVPLKERKEIANKYNKNETIFISIHCNAGGGTGFELYTTRGITNSDRLAENIANAVECIYGEVDLRLRYDLSDGDKDKEADFYVLRKTTCPAVLLECGFFDNERDFELLSDPNFQEDLADNIYAGIMDYIKKENRNG